MQPRRSGPAPALPSIRTRLSFYERAGGRRARLLATVALLPLIVFPRSVHAAPTGGVANAASPASITSTPTATGTNVEVDLKQQRTLIDWSSFNINSGETATFNFGRGHNDWIALNRVNSGSATIKGDLLGCLGSCSSPGGNIWLFASDGVVIGPNARVNAGGFLATTAPLATSDSAFLSGANALDFGDAKPGSSIQMAAGASITGHGGMLAFVSPQITTAPGSSVTNTPGSGTVLYGAAQSFRIQFADDGESNLDLVSFEVPAGRSGGSDSKTPISLGGATTAGKVYVAAVSKQAVIGALVDAGGTITATRVGKEGGDIVLSGDGDVEVGGSLSGTNVSATASNGGVSVDGTVSARAPDGAGGNITITANAVSLGASSTLDASGTTGGRILVGGDVHGGANPSQDFSPTPVVTANTTTVAAGATIKADASSGRGGRVVVWSNDDTNFAGTISAKGNGGDGGFAEVSGKKSLGFTGTVDLRAVDGVTGTLLLDPGNVTISALPTAGILGIAPPSATIQPASGFPDATLAASDLVNALKTANILVTTTNGGAGVNAHVPGFINVDAPVISKSNDSLTLNAASDININADINLGTGTLDLMAGGVISQATLSSVITAGTLTGSSVGGTTLNGHNKITNLGTFDNKGTGDFQLTDAQTLTVIGPVDGAAHDTGNVTLTTTSGNLILGANVTTPPGQAVTLNAAGTITQTGGIITTGTLTGSSAGGATLNDANKITNLGAFDNTGSGDFQLTNAQALTVNGPLDGAALDTGNVVLKTTTGDLVLTGNVTTPLGQAVALTSAGAINQTGGIISTGALKGVSAGSASFGSPGNAIGALAGFQAGASVAGGNFSLFDGRGLDVTGAVSAVKGAAPGTGNVTIETTGPTTNGMTLDASLTADAASGALQLVSAGAISQNASPGASTITASTLAGSAKLDTALTSATNDVDTLSGFTANGSLSYRDIDALTVTGVSAGTALSIEAGGTLTTTGLGASGLSGGTTTALTADIGDLLLQGDVNAGTTETLTATAGNITQGAGTITAGTLTGHSLISTTLTDATNDVDTLSGFTAGGSLSYRDVDALTATGVSAGTALSIEAGGTLTTTGLGASGLSGGTTITLIADTGDLLLQGDVTAGTTATLTASTGNITQSAGTITAATLTGSSQLDTSLPDSNAVGTLSGFSSATGSLTFVDAGPLTVTGDGAAKTLSIRAGGALSASALLGTDITLEAKAGDLLLASDVSATGTVTLIADLGNITQSAGTITAATLTGRSALDTTLTDATNDADTLSGFAAGGSFRYRDIDALTATNVSAGAALSIEAGAALTTTGVGASGLSGGTTTTLTADTGDLLLQGDVNAGTTEMLTATTGNITQSAGSITAATLTGSSAGNTTLSSATNDVDTLSGFAANGSLSYRDVDALMVTGVSAGTALSIDAGGTLTTTGLGASGVSGGTTAALAADTGDLLLQGDVKAGTTATLTATAGNITQAAGAITAGTLSGSSAGSTTLTSATNDVATLSGFAAGGSFSYRDVDALTATNVSAGTALSIEAGAALTTMGIGASGLSGGTTTVLTADTGDLLLQGDIHAGTTATLTATTGNITQSAGAITATTLTGSSQLDTSLTDPNAVGTLSGFHSATGNLAFINAGALTATNDSAAKTISIKAGGTLSASGISGNATNLEATSGDLVLTGDISATTTATLTSDLGNILQNAGTITAPVLTGSSQLDTTLTDANAVANFTGFSSAAGNVTFVNAGALTATGDSAAKTISITAGGTLSASGISGNAVALEAKSGDLLLTGNISATATATLISDLGGITQNIASTVTAGALTGFSLADTSLIGSNAIATLGAFDTSKNNRNFTLDDNHALDITGAVTAGTGTVDLAIAAALSESTGSITASTLTGSSIGGATLSGNNRIADLGSFDNTGSGDFQLTDAQSLNVTGPLDDAHSDTGNVTLTTKGGGDLVFNANVTTQPGQTVTLVSSGSISQVGGIITTGTLTGSAAGSTALNDNNRITDLGTFESTGGAFSLTDTVALSVTGTLDATGQAVTLTNTGGGIDASAGTVKAATLTGSTQGAADFSNPGNAIGTLNGFTNTAGGFSLADSIGLTVTNTLEASGQTVALNDSGGGIDAHAGIIKAATLTGSSAGVADFSNAGNVIPTLNGFTNNGGAFSLTDSVALAITGVLDVSGQTLTLIDTGGGIDASAGIVKAATLTGSAAGDVAFTDPANQISTLAGFTSAGNFSLVDDPDLVITGTLNAAGHAVLLEALSGSIDAHAASLVADSLQGSAAMGADFTGTNTINTLGNFTVTTNGVFLLADSQALNIAGVVQNHVGAMTIETTGGGNITIAGTLDATGQTLTLISAGQLNESVGKVLAGTIVTGTLTGSSGNGVHLTSQNSIGTLGDFSTGGGNFDLTVNESLVVAGKIQSASGSITLQATAGDLTVLGPVTAGQTVTFKAAGNFVQNDNLIAANELDIVAGGNILIGEKSFTDFVGNPALAPEAINLAIDMPFFRPSAGFKDHVFIQAETVKLTAPGKIISENTGTQPNVNPYQPNGIVLTQNGVALPLALLIDGKPAVVDLFGSLTQDGIKIDPKTVATSGQVQLAPTTPPKTRYRVNGCTIHQNLTCVAIHVDINNVEPAKLADLVLLAAPSPDNEENDPTITGSGNDEIWREQ